MPEPQYLHKFRYPVHELQPGETVLERWPELAIHQPLVDYGFGDKDPLLRYAIYLSEGSGLHAAVADWGERKAEAARLAGISTTHPRYDAILNYSDDATRALRWAWMELTNNRLYQDYVVGCEIRLQTVKKLEAPIPEAGTIDADEQEGGKQKYKNNTDLKADAEMRTYGTRIDLYLKLDALEEKLKSLELRLFFDDEDMKKQAAEEAKPQAARDSWEERVFKRKK